MNMIEVFKEFVNSVSTPVTIFSLAVGIFIIFVTFPRLFTSIPAGITLLVGSIGFLAIGWTDEHFRTIVSMPDNVPIVGMVFVFGYFTWYAMRKAVLNDIRMDQGLGPKEKEESEEKVLVFPYLIYIEFVIALVYAIGLVVWAILLKAPLEEPANPTVSPNPSKAPWYFLGLQEMLVYFDPWIAGVLLPTLIIVGLCAMPYLDRNTKTSGFFCFKPRRLGISVFLFGMWVLWFVLILFGTFLRGPNWNFFGPFEVWDAHKLVPLLNVNLSEIIFIKWLGMGPPKLWFIREAPGILLILIYFAVPPLILAKTVCKEIYAKLGAVRYQIFCFVLLMMLALPIKMYLRWAFNLKYIVGIPEFFFNI